MFAQVELEAAAGCHHPVLALPVLPAAAQSRGKALIPAWLSQERGFLEQLCVWLSPAPQGFRLSCESKEKKIQCQQVFDHSYGKNLDF